MKNARARLALLGVLALSALGAASASPAEALDSYYNCVLKPSNSWCDGQANGSYDGQYSYDYNEAWYPGAWDGTVTACQRLIRTSDSFVLTGSSCAANTSYSNYTGNTITVEANIKQISGGDHSINGHAIAN
jgi:hypothetical protein